MDILDYLFQLLLQVFGWIIRMFFNIVVWLVTLMFSNIYAFFVGLALILLVCIVGYCTSSSDRPENKEAVAVELTTTYYCIARSSLNVRKAPSTSSQVVGQLKPNEAVEVYEKTNNGFAKIKFGADYAYVSLDYLSTSKIAPEKENPVLSNREATKEVSRELSKEEPKSENTKTSQNEQQVENAQKAKEEKDSQSKAIIDRLVNNMVYVNGGEFIMGADKKYATSARYERPAHRVTISSFSIGIYEITQEEWQAVMGNNPSWYKGARRPVENVSWFDCIEFVKKLNSITGRKFRLPTEAEWEFAARGGLQSMGYICPGSDDGNTVSWNIRNSGKETHPVGGLKPNELGLYDMGGNVSEWCYDTFANFTEAAQVNPKGASSGDFKVIRGGHWNNYPEMCNVAYRMRDVPRVKGSYTGFRLAE